MLKLIKHIIPIILFAIIMSVTVFSEENKAHSIIVKKYGIEKQYNTIENTLQNFLEEYDIKIQETDLLSHPLDTQITDDFVFEIIEGVQVVININGEKEVLKVKEGTEVGEVINMLSKENNQNYILNNKNLLENSVVSKKHDINLLSEHYETINYVETIEYKTIYIENDSLEYNEQNIISYGVDGLKEISETKYYLGNDVVDMQTVENILKDPVDEVIEIGTKKYVLTPNGNETYSTLISMNASAYTAGYESTGKTPSHPAYGITSSGMRVTPGVVAVDPNVIPIGTILFVEGYGIAIAADTGSAIKGNKIDLYYENLNDAINFGRQNLNVYVLDTTEFKR